MLKTLVADWLIDPGSEWRRYRHWFDHSAMGDLLGADVAMAHGHTRYRCLDQLVEHQEAWLSFLQQRWRLLFAARFEVLRYDLTSTDFACNPPESDKRQCGYSRDHRVACLQVVIALIVTPEGFPLAAAVRPGKTLDHRTLKDFLAKIETQYSQTDRVWVMDRGIPTDATLALMRQADPPVHSLVGTPTGRLSTLEPSFLTPPWARVRDQEQAMRQRWLQRRCKRLQELQRQAPSRDQRLLKRGAAKQAAGRAYGVVTVRIPEEGQAVSADTVTVALDRQKRRQVRRREGRYLRRSHPAQRWSWFIQLTEAEHAFKALKGDLASARSTTNATRTSSSPSSPPVSRPPARPVCARWLLDGPGPPWNSSAPSRWSMCTCRPPMAAP